MILNCIIIEDEPLAASKLKDFIGKVSSLNLTGVFENPVDALCYMRENATDLIFLDIQMEELTGIQFLESLTQKPFVIITTAYAEYAVKGYELQVEDYLLKPFSFERFLAAVNHVYDDYSSKHINHQKNKNIFIKTEYRVENVKIDDILFIEGMQNYLKVVLTDRKILTKQSFKSLCSNLPPSEFIQVHKSWVVNISKIRAIEKNRINIGNILIPIGETFRENFFKSISK